MRLRTSLYLLAVGMREYEVAIRVGSGRTYSPQASNLYPTRDPMV